MTATTPTPCSGARPAISARISSRPTTTRQIIRLASPGPPQPAVTESRATAPQPAQLRWTDRQGETSDNGRRAGRTHCQADRAAAGQAWLEGDPGEGLRPWVQGRLRAEEGRARPTPDRRDHAGRLSGSAGRG